MVGADAQRGRGLVGVNGHKMNHLGAHLDRRAQANQGIVVEHRNSVRHLVGCRVVQREGGDQACVEAESSGIRGHPARILGSDRGAGQQDSQRAK